MQREGWSKLLQFYCADMLEQCQTKVFQSLSIEILCSHWQDLCLEVICFSSREVFLSDRFVFFQLRDAARKLLEKELDHLHKNTEAWQIFLIKWSNLFMQSYNKENDGALHDPEIRDIFLDEMTYNTETITMPTTVNEQYKSQQLLSIVLIGIVGARYGQEIEPAKPANTLTKANAAENPDLIFKLSKISYSKMLKNR